MVRPEVIASSSFRPSYPQLFVAVGFFPNRTTRLIREFRASRLSSEPFPHNDDLPAIEALIVSTEKDFESIKFVIQNIQSGSRNLVESLSIITPKVSVANCLQLVEEYQPLFSRGINVIDEDSVFSSAFRQELKDAFGRRYGWVLQQLLTTNFVFSSGAAGVLTINADTVLLRPRKWLDSESNQSLLVSSEFHKPYYELLHKLFRTKKRPKNTFVTHHMLMQPEILRTLLKKEGITSVEQLGKDAISFADLSIESPVCLEFELYGQLISKHHPELVSFNKFSNIGISLSTDQIPTMIQKYRDNADLYSVSFHSYLRPEQG